MQAAEVSAIRERPPLADIEHDLHLLEVIEAVKTAASECTAVRVESDFRPLALRWDVESDATHLHDHARPADEQ